MSFSLLKVLNKIFFIEKFCCLSYYKKRLNIFDSIVFKRIIYDLIILKRIIFDSIFLKLVIFDSIVFKGIIYDLNI